MRRARSRACVLARASDSGVHKVLRSVGAMRSREGSTMTKSENVDFQEMFGSSTVAESLNADAPVLQPAPEPWLPTDDSLWNFLDESLGKDGEHALDVAFIKEISGYERTTAPQVPEAESLLESSAFEKVIHKTATTLENVPRHRQAMQLICDRLRKSSALSPALRADPAWDDLVTAGTKFITGSVFAGCR